MLKTKRSFDINEWNNWKFQVGNAITTYEELIEWINISEIEKASITACAPHYKMSITPYYASLMDKDDDSCPIRKQSIANIKEITDQEAADIDPIGDMTNLKTYRVIHQYPNRIVLLANNNCAMYCRHCTRKFHTTACNGTYYNGEKNCDFSEDFKYIKNHPEIDDILISGGDPLMLSDSKLEMIVKNLRDIPHVNIIRVCSRAPVVMPQRITSNLCQMLDKYHPVWFNTHFNHPREITEESAAACDLLLRHGIPVQNQSVLLKGINDNLDTIKHLSKELLRIRVRPYCLYHCDNVKGVTHFVTSLKTGLDIMEGLIGFETGFAIPTYSLTTKLGKILLCHEHLYKKDDRIFIENYNKDRLDITDFLPYSNEDLDYLSSTKR